MTKRQKMITKILIVLLCVIVTTAIGCQVILSQNNSLRDTSVTGSSKWAEKISNSHLQNFFKVSPILYRGAQPDANGMKELQRLGIKSVINLRELHSDADELKGTALKAYHIRSTAAKINLPEVKEFLEIMADPQNLPAFVHCQHGSDRTGTMCAFYRMVYQGWDKKEAIAELTKGGFGFHEIWRKFIIPFIEKTDIQALRAAYAKTDSPKGSKDANH